MAINKNITVDPFFIKDCALSTLATGIRAGSLAEFRDRLAVIDPHSIYHHFWGGRLRPQFTHPDYHNDFAAWAHRSLHDNILAEQLSVIDPTEFQSLEELRQKLLDVVENRLEEKEILLWRRREDQFYFVNSKILVFQTPYVVHSPEELQKILPSLSLHTIFYHFIDARIRTPNGVDDFSHWLTSWGEPYAPLVQKIQGIDLYFLTLTELRRRLNEVMETFHGQS